MITIYTLTYNEELLIQFMIDHYRSRFPNCRIVINDNMSTDDTVKIALSNNCDVLSFDTNDKYNEGKQMEIRNNCWKKAKTDWVLVCDLDELMDISIQELRNEEKIGSTIIKTECYDMINMENNFDFIQMKYGVKSDITGKFILFNKKFINEMNYGAGSHSCAPVGKISYSKSSYPLYHYNSINENLTIEKFKNRSLRFSPENLKNGWGLHYLMTPEQIKEEYKIERSKAVKTR